jgi:hypothetical protein
MHDPAQVLIFSTQVTCGLGGFGNGSCGSGGEFELVMCGSKCGCGSNLSFPL